MSSGLTHEQRRAVHGLVEREVLSAEQAEVMLAELDAARSPRTPFGIGVSEVLGCVGGVLVLGGAGLLLHMSWDDLGRAVRAGLLVAATVVLGAAGVVIAGGPRGVRALAGIAPSARSRIVAVLFALGAGTAAMAVPSGFENHDPSLIPLAGLAVALLGYLALPSVPGLLMSGGFSVALVLTATEEWFWSSTPVATIGLIVLGLVWALLAGAGKLVQRQVGLGGGAGIALMGGQWPVIAEAPAWGHAATLVIALLCFAVYLVQQSAVLLAAGVVGVTLAVPEAVWDWTGDALGGPLAVLLVGVVLLAASGLGLRLHKAASEAG